MLKIESLAVAIASTRSYLLRVCNHLQRSHETITKCNAITDLRQVTAAALQLPTLMCGQRVDRALRRVYTQSPALFVRNLICIKYINFII